MLSASSAASFVIPGDPSWYDFLHKGVNFSIAGTGGPECAAFVPTTQKVVETCATVLLTFAGLLYAASRMQLPVSYPAAARSSNGWQQAVLVLLCLTFGVEVGYKLSTKSIIWLVNPCHLHTITQIVLLAAPCDGRRRWVTAVFRLQMHALHGAFVALVLPVTNTRQLPFEVVVYYVQHVLIVAIPFFLLAKGGAYTAEPFRDFSWAIASWALILLIYFVPVQGLSLVTGVNLNNMLCPAISDPFYGTNYRLWALLHSSLAIFLFGKLYSLGALAVVDTWTRLRRHTAPAGNAATAQCGGLASADRTNGHAKGH